MNIRVGCNDMDLKVFTLVGVEIFIIIILSIVINQVLHKFLAEKRLNFLTPVFNLIVLLVLLVLIDHSVDKICLDEMSEFKDICDKFSNYIVAVAVILGIIYIIQFITNLRRYFKYKQELILDGTVELPMFKAGIDFTKKDEKEYPIFNNRKEEKKEIELPKIAAKKCPKCEIEYEVDSKSCDICTLDFGTFEDKQ